MMVRFAAYILTFLFAGGALAEEEVITINFRAVEELAGGEAAGKVAAALAPKADPLADKTMYAPIDPARVMAAKADPSRSLQILYGRGDLIISPSAKDVLVEWIKSFVKPASRVEILSYSGARNPAWDVPGNDPGDLKTLTLHEAIRTAFKRALVVRDILTENGIADDGIVVRALGPVNDGGPPERIDVVLVTGS